MARIQGRQVLGSFPVMGGNVALLNPSDLMLTPISQHLLSPTNGLTHVEEHSAVVADAQPKGVLWV